jgi:hypothetical protein
MIPAGKSSARAKLKKAGSFARQRRERRQQRQLGRTWRRRLLLLL